MKLENRVIDLELARKLNELGVKQSSLFSYIRKAIDYEERKEVIYEKKHSLTSNIGVTCGCYREPLSAFITDELLDLLPENIRGFELLVSKGNVGYWENGRFSLHSKDKQTTSQFIDNKTSNALANLLIFLIENNYVNVK